MIKGDAREPSPLVSEIERAAADIHRMQPRLNAFIETTDEDAIQAAEANCERAAGGAVPRRLENWTVAFKDMFDRPGRSCTYGAALPREASPEVAASVVRLMEEAGAVTMGFLNMSEFALGPTGHNATFGHCRNAWNTDYVSGGSSSGAAAAVAAGLIRVAIGSDTGGSIRIPASCCGVVGLKPTQYRVNSDGAMALSPSLDCFGPIAKSAADCETAFTVLTGSPPEELGLSRLQASGERWRVVYPGSYIRLNVANEIAEALDATAAQLRDLGFTVEETLLPSISTLHRLADTIQTFESILSHGDRLRRFRSLYTPHVLKRIEPGLAVSMADYRAARDARPAYLEAFLDSCLRGADALLIPTIGHPVPTIEETDEERCGSIPELVVRMTRWTRWLNFLGVPALSLPCGFDRVGNPIGIQLVGAPNSEAKLFAIAKLFQSVTRWHRIEPPHSVGREAAVPSRCEVQ